jgi:hypothetical protein
MDAAQRYLWDLHGFLVIEQGLSRDELERARAAAYSATSAGEPFAVHCTPELAPMPFHPKIWPIVLELTVSPSNSSARVGAAGSAPYWPHTTPVPQDNKPMMRHSFGIHNRPRQNIDGGGGGPLHCNRESHRSSVFGSPNLGQAMNGTSQTHEGKPYSVDFVCFVYLDTVGPADGGLLLVPASFKSNFERPAAMFGAYGRAHYSPPEGIAQDGHTRPRVEPGVPEHAVNLCPRAGDLVFMSEGTSQCVPVALLCHTYTGCHAFNPPCNICFPRIWRG